MIVATVHVGEYWFFAYIAEVSVIWPQCSKITVASTALLQVTEFIVPKDTVGYTRNRTSISSNAKLVINYSQISKLRRSTITYDSCLSAIGDYKIAQDAS
jgi:hypothetical protein